MDRSITRTECSGKHPRAGAELVVMLLCVGMFLLLLFALPSHAADWQQAERNCLRTCPPMPRYSGQESEKQFKERMRQQAAYDRCFMSCARQSTDRFTPTFVPIGEDAQRYFKRNGATTQ